MGGTVLLALKDHLVQLIRLALREGMGQWGKLIRTRNFDLF